MKRFISIMLSVLIISSMISGFTMNVNADEIYSQNNINTETNGVYEYYNNVDGTLTITGYSGNETELMIPSSIDSFEVTAIGDYAFGSCDSITDVIVPDSVVSIGDYAFSACTNLKNVVIGDSVTYMGVSAFRSCNYLESITLGASVETIDQYAFAFCRSLKNVVLPESVTKINDNAFYVCPLMEKIVINNPKCAISDSPNTLANNAVIFGHKNSLAEAYAEEYNREFKEIGDSTEDLPSEEGVVYGRCGGSIIWKFEESTGTITFSGTGGINPYSGGGDIETPWDDFKDSIRVGIVEEGITEIGSYVFSFCPVLENVQLADSVTEIGNAAFCCSGIEVVELSKYVEKVGFFAFDECENLLRIYFRNPYCKVIENTNTCDTIPITTTIYGYENSPAYVYAMKYDMNFISLGAPVEDETQPPTEFVTSGSCGENATWEFNETSGFLYIGGSGKMDDYDSAEATPWSALRSEIKSIRMSYEITSVGSYAFSKCLYAQSVDIGEKVESIGENSFYGCASLTEVVLPFSVEVVENKAFDGCFNIEKIEVNNIDCVVNCEEGCDTFPQQAVIYAYTDSSALNYAVTRNMEYVELYLKGICGQDVTWSYDKTSATLTISGSGAMSKETLSLDENSFTHLKDQIKHIIIEDGVTSISDNAFAQCKNLKDVQIGKDVETVGNYAFAYSYELEYITFPKSVSNLGSNLFYDSAILVQVDILNPDCVITDSETVFPANTRICGYENSTAQEYAEKYNRTFIVCSETVEPTEPESEDVVNGTCGGNVTWQFNKTTGTITFSGTGAIDFYTGSVNVCPWDDYKSMIKTAIIQDGITEIGTYALSNCTNLTKVEIEQSVTTFGVQTFYRCTSLKTIVLEENITRIGGGCFQGCTSLESMYVYNRELVFDGMMGCPLPSTVTLYGYLNSTAEQQSKWYSLKFMPIDPNETYPPTLNPELKPSFYLVGTLGGEDLWSVETLEPERMLTPCSDGLMTYCIEWTFKKGDEIKIAYFNGEAFTSWYKDGEDAFVITEESGLVGYGRLVFTVIGNSSWEYVYFDITPTTPVTSGSCGENVEWSFSDETGAITITGTGEMNDYGDSLNSVPWNALKDAITSVEISDGVTHISSNAFANVTELSTISLGKDVETLGDNAFSNCTSLKDIYIYNPDFDIDAFAGTSIVIPEDATIYGYTGSTAQTYALENNIKFVVLDEEQIEPTEEPTQKPSLEVGQKYQYGVFTYVLLSDNTIEIVGYTGSDKKITIPSEIDGYKVSSIGENAFYNAYTLKKITIENGIEIIGNSAFKNCIQLIEIEIPESVTTIGECAFYNCSRLTEIELPDSVTEIGEKTFYQCQKLKKVQFGSNVKHLQNKTFYGCSDLTELIVKEISRSKGDIAVVSADEGTNTEIVDAVVEIPSSVTTIGDSVFGGCSSISKVVMHDGVTEIGAKTFDSCAGLTEITLSKNLNDIQYSLFNGCNSLLSIEIPDGVEKIDHNAFDGCESLSEVVLPDSITEIEVEAFANCIALTNIEIPDSDVQLKASSFYGCTNLTDITLGDGTTSIGDGAFYSCSNLKNIVIGKSVETIDWFAFWDCSSLETITIPENVHEIGFKAFDNCENLSSVYILNPECELIDFSTLGGTIPATATIYGYRDSSAQEYAEKYGRTFVALDDEATPDQPSTQEPTQSPSEQTNPLGDVDKDGVITVVDATMVQKSLACLIVLDEQALILSDVNHDNTHSITDATLIQMLVANIITQF